MSFGVVQVHGKGESGCAGAGGTARVRCGRIVVQDVRRDDRLLQKHECEFKSEDFLYANALVLNGAFTKFTCPSCQYSPNAARAKADLATFRAMSDDERKIARQAHVKGGRIGMLSS